jgi:1-acyl-sn-glycerol-3-phosphate acyltransferase
MTDKPRGYDVSSRDRLVPWFYAMIQRLMALAMRLLYRIQIEGTERVPPAGALLVVCNHSSFLDPPAIGAMFPRQLHFLAKRELFGIPLFGRIIAALGSVPIARGSVDRGALETVSGVLRHGGALLLFPEGTRSSDGTPQPPKPGIGFLVAQLRDVKIVPLRISGTYDSWPRQRRFPRRGRIHIAIGESFAVSEMLTRLETDLLETEKDCPSPESVSAAGEPVPAMEKKMPSRGKKRLYWAVAEEIMKRIESVKEKNASRNQKPTSM